WRWIGTNGIVFAPKNELPRATEWLVTVPPGTRALDGSTMKSAYELRFSTPTPHVVDARPSSDDHLLPNAPFEFEFDQPIDLAEVEKNVELFAADQKKPVKIERVKDKSARFRALPSSPLPLDSAIKLVIGKLRGTSGPLPMEETHTVDNHTYPPLTAVSASCYQNGPHNKCPAAGSISLNFSNPIR